MHFCGETFSITYHEKSLLHKLELRDKLLLLYLQLLHSLTGFISLITLACHVGVRLHKMCLLQKIDLQLFLKLLHQLFQLFASCICHLLKFKQNKKSLKRKQIGLLTFATVFKRLYRFPQFCVKEFLEAYLVMRKEALLLLHEMMELSWIESCLTGSNTSAVVISDLL